MKKKLLTKKLLAILSILSLTHVCTCMENREGVVGSKDLSI